MIGKRVSFIGIYTKRELYGVIVRHPWTGVFVVRDRGRLAAVRGDEITGLEEVE
jgi:hypothetical protein